MIVQSTKHLGTIRKLRHPFLFIDTSHPPSKWANIIFRMTPHTLCKVKYHVIFHEIHLWPKNLIHEIEHHPCPQCDKQARQSQNLRQHVKTVHEGVRYPCNLCDYKTTTKSRLHSHQSNNHKWFNNTFLNWHI